MTVQLRPYQADLKRDIYDAWQRGARNVLAVAPTGAGKTVLFSSVIQERNVPSVAIAHRQELVAQISLALARNAVRHRIIGQPALIRNCVQWHLLQCGRSYYDANAKIAAAGVHTLVRMSANDPWFKSVGLVIGDEFHHGLAENMWGQAVSMFPNALLLGLTATPTRADGKGLGRHADGLIDEMVVGPTMRDLIRQGFLTEYRIYAPPSDIDLSGVALSASGDFSPDPLRKAVHASHVVGDVVEHYLRVAPGKLGVTFAVDVESSTEIAAAFRQAGVPAEAISAKTPDAVRMQIQRRFAAGEIKQLVNCDLLGEGYDLPAIEVVSMARPTQSYSLFVQQFGRALRLKDGKEFAVILDHAGNTARHGLPDRAREWSLDRREKRGKSRPIDTIAVRTCPKCLGVYERGAHGLTCPYCHATSEPASRSQPEHVDGDLYELDADTLARMRGEVDKSVAWHPDRVVQMTLDKRHREKQAAQELLRESIALWGGKISQDSDIESARRMQRAFFAEYGIDVLSAQALGVSEANALRERIENNLRG